MKSKPSADGGILARIKDNPFLYLTQEQISEIFGFGEDTVCALIRHGAPTVARKINPRIFFSWLEQNGDRLSEMGKVRDEIRKTPVVNPSNKMNRPKSAQIGPNRRKSGEIR